MFTRNIGRPMLASEIADRFFENISCSTEMFMRDYSLVATIRALIAPRMAEGDKLDIKYRDRSLDASTAHDHPPANVINHIFGSPSARDTFAMINLTSQQTDNEATLEVLDTHFLALHSGFRELTDIKAFVSVNMDARFYINEERRTAFVVVSRLTMSKYHFLQALVSRYFPWYCADKPLVEDERALAKSCSNRNSSEYERLIAEFANKYDLRKAQIRMIVGDFEKNTRREQIRRANDDLSRVNRSIDENLEQYTTLCAKRENAMVRLEGLQSLQNKVDERSELIEFFEVNKNLNPLSAEGGAIRFIVRGYLENFDADNYECYARNWDSCYYTGYDVDEDELRSPENRKLVLDAIFSDNPKLKVRICGYYELFMSGDARSSRGYDYPPEYKDCMPNPHLHNHNCLGNQNRFIKEALLRGDMLMAVTQCISSVSSVNTGESASMRPFVRDLFNCRDKRIEGPDGKLMTAVEALKWLKEQQTAA